MARHARRSITALAALALGWAAGCSFVSSADDLAGAGGAPSTGGTAGGSGIDALGGKAGASGALGGGGTAFGGSGGAAIGGSSGSSGNAASGAAGAISPGGSAGAAGSPVAGAGGLAGAGGQVTAGAGGSAGGAGQASSPTGAIVMGGVASGDEGSKDVLLVLDPTTGKERSREPMVVAAIAHDGDAGKERWFIFESLGFAEPTPTDEVRLHVRTLDAATGTWTELSAVKLPSLVIGSVTVLSQRIAYLGYVEGSATKRRIVLVSDDADGFHERTLPAENSFTTASASGLLGIRNPNGVGGTLDVIGVTAAPCAVPNDPQASGICDVTLRPVTVDGSGATLFAAKKALSFPYSAGAQATWTASASSNTILNAFPAKAPTLPFLRQFSPAGVTALGQAIPFAASGSTFRSMAFDECNGLSFLTELNADQAVFAIPTKKVASAGVQSLGKPGQRVLYEPTTKSVLVPFSQGGTHSLRAFTVDTSADPPTMTERPLSTWAPPVDVAPGPIAVRARVAGFCD